MNLLFIKMFFKIASTNIRQKQTSLDVKHIHCINLFVFMVHEIILNTSSVHPHWREVFSIINKLATSHKAQKYRQPLPTPSKYTLLVYLQILMQSTHQKVIRCINVNNAVLEIVLLVLY